MDSSVISTLLVSQQKTPSLYLNFLSEAAVANMEATGHSYLVLSSVPVMFPGRSSCDCSCIVVVEFPLLRFSFLLFSAPEIRRDRTLLAFLSSRDVREKWVDGILSRWNSVEVYTCGGRELSVVKMASI